MKQPVRVFEGSAKPYTPFWRLIDAAESDSGEPEIEFYGYISEYTWFGDEITPAMFKKDLNTLGKGGPITIRINSGGGEVFAASVIRSMIMEYPGRVTTRIDGLCASAATFVATAGDVVKMQDSAFFMIHDPAILAWGNIEELKSLLNELKVVKDGIIQTYQSKTGLESEKISKMMTAETWMTAQEAKDLGFVDEIINQPVKSVDRLLQNAAILNCLQNYSNVPPELLKTSEQDLAIAEENPQSLSDAGVGEDLPHAGIDEREVQRLRDYLDIFA